VSLGRRTAVMAAGTLLSRVTGLARNMALAYALGTTALAGTFVLAYETPLILYELVLGGVLSGTLVPVFVRAFERDEQEGWDAVSAVFTFALVVSTALAVLFVAVAPLFIRLYTLRNSGDLEDDQLAVATTLLRLFAPQVLFYGLVTLSTAISNARRRFAAPMFAPVLNNVVATAALLAFPVVSNTTALDRVRGDRGALLLLGLGTTAGVAANALAQLPWRDLRGNLRLRWNPRHPALRTVAGLMGWTLGFVVANQVAVLVVRFLANANPGDIAVYYLAYVLFVLPHGVLSVSISTAIAPELSSRWAADDRAGFRDQLSTGVRTILAVTVPAAVGYLVLARPIVATLLEYGALGGRSGRLVADCLALFAIGLPGYSAFYFLNRAYQAIQDTRSLFFLYVVENGINIVLAVALYPSLGVQGLALAYAIAYLGGALCSLVHLRGRTGAVDVGAIASTAARVLVAAAAMGAAIAVVAQLVGSERGSGAVLRVAVAVPTGVSVYLAAARVLGVSEVSALLPRRRQG
jgi:putative peptidoglycan lipid II flippase